MDLAPCDYFRGIFSTEKLKAVGWLARGHAYPTRQTEFSDEHFRRLLRLLKDPWQPGCFMGMHECDFCVADERDDRRFTLERYGTVIHFGISNLFVPGQDSVFVAPSMIAHYIDRHSYEPPAEFWRAILSCPDMQSGSYKEALLANGPSDAQWIRVVSHA